MGGRLVGQVKCAFLIPILRNSDRKPHRPLVWDALLTRLLEVFGGITGPEIVLQFQNLRPGDWKDAKGTVVNDESRLYTITIPSAKVEELRTILKKAANSFDQECIYLEVSPVDVEFVSGEGEGELV